MFSDQGSGSQAFGRVAGSDGDFHLAKDRTIIKFRRDDMDGAACNIVPCLQCALMRVEALIFGEERWMNVEHPALPRSEEHTSELPSLMRISYAVFCLKKKKNSKP